MLNVRLAGGDLYGKQLFTWLSLVVSFMASFVLSFFPLDVLDGIGDLIESVSEGFLTYFCSYPFPASSPARLSGLSHDSRVCGLPADPPLCSHAGSARRSACAPCACFGH